MRRTPWVVVLAMVLVATGTLLVAAPGRSNLRFGAHLTGAEEVPARTTDATGHTVFSLSPDGTTLRWRLIVDDITNVVASHIHVGAEGTNGPVVLFLAGPFAPGGGPVEGILAEGTATSANLVGPLAGMSLDVLIGHMRSGNAYVNVHTNDGVDPQNTGPGDFPGGEIRGQIAARGPRSGVGPEKSAGPRPIRER
jgi:hypothetical protein